MRASCTCESLSYPIWRLRFFRQLLLQSDSPLIPLEFLYPRHLPRRARSFTNHGTGSLPPQETETIEHHAGIPSGRGKTEDISLKSQTVNAQPRLAERREPESWKPCTPQGRQDLQGLVQSLGKLAEGVENNTELRSKRKGLTFIRPRMLTSLPESPLLRRIKKDRLHKRRSEPYENAHLSKNPWARILASPVRHCQGTAVRVPSDLLMSWGLIRNPNDGKPYFMPDDVVSREALEALQSKDKISTASLLLPSKHDSSIEEECGQQTAGKVPARETEEMLALSEPADTHSANPSKQRMIPLKPMLQGFNTRFQKNGKNVNRILSERWRNALVAAHNKAKRHLKDGTAVKDPSDAAKSHVMAPNLSDIRWQMNIDGRLGSILQGRVIAALGKFVGAVTEPKSSELIKIPLPLGFQQPSGLNQEPVSDLSPSNDEAAVSRIEKFIHGIEGAVFIVLGNGTSSKAQLLQSFARADGKESMLMLQPVTTLHDDMNLTWTSRIPNGVAPFEPLPRHPLIPPMINVAAKLRIPVFYLSKILDGHESDIENLLKQFPCLAPPTTTDLQTFDTAARTRSQADHRTDNSLGSTSTLDDVPYLLLVRPRGRTGRNLIEEVWRLWRYVGGRKHNQNSTESAQRYSGDIFGYTTDAGGTSDSYSQSLWQTGDLSEVKVRFHWARARGLSTRGPFWRTFPAYAWGPERKGQ